MDVYLNFTPFQTKYRWSSHKGHMYLGYTLSWHIMVICIIICWSAFCCLNSPDPTRHRLHYTLCAVVSGMKMLATDPLSLGSCKVGPPFLSSTFYRCSIWLRIWQIWRPSQHLKLFLFVRNKVHYSAERGHNHRGILFLYRHTISYACQRRNELHPASSSNQLLTSRI